MAFDKSAFLLCAGALAAGGAGGYFYNDRGKPIAPPEGPPAIAVAAIDAGHAVPAAPACDDAVGTPGECPPSGAPSASDEGLCGGTGSVAARRCRDYKTALKPRVAEAAVACLNKLPPAQACDLNRANLCGHEALMLACQEPLSASRSALNSTTITAAAPESEAEPPSPLATQCGAIVRSCSGTIPGTSLADCHRTLSGMTDVGRGNMVECMKTHCEDKGLIGCEAWLPPAH
jgi:hypothetical protein